MAKNRMKMTEKKISILYKEGRGAGDKEEYKPFLYAQDVPSSGVVVREKGWKTGRTHHFLSKLESNFFYMLEWNEEVIDIKEQFPLPRDSTVTIADEEGIKHPYYDPELTVPVVMTTDFLYTVKGKGDKPVHYARTIKPSNKLESARTIEKLEIERRFWEMKGVDWGIVTEKEIDKHFTKNMEWIHQSYYLSEEYIQNDLELYAEHLNETLDKKGCSYREALHYLEESYNMEFAECLALFKHLIATRRLKVNMLEDISLLNGKK